MSDDDKPAWLVAGQLVPHAASPRRASETGTPIKHPAGWHSLSANVAPFGAMATARTLVVHSTTVCRWQWQRRCDLSRTSGGNRGRRSRNPWRFDAIRTADLYDDAGFCKECDAATALSTGQPG